MKDKANTKQRLISSVGEIISTEGYAALQISKVARRAGVDRKLVYRYFGNLDGLIEAYIAKHDYWILLAEELKQASDEEGPGDPVELIIEILQNQFSHFYSEKDMQNLILLELSAPVPLLRSIHHVREMLGQKLFLITDDLLKETPVNFRAISALLVGGIYYTILHTRFNGGLVSDVDLNDEAGRRSLLDAIEQVVKWSFGRK